jgi:tRNA pseudouridine55 synthase
VIDGFLVVDKPVGVTSHDVVSILRRTLHQKKIGHTGTLDPFATGVLPIALGEGTKAIPYLDESVKEYQAVMRLGISTDTLDLTGSVVLQRDWSHVTQEMIHSMIPRFTGNILQMPPMFSAIKQGGVPLYKLARKGETVERKEREVVIHSLVIDRILLPEIAFTVRCSRGTYVRTLADDIGEALRTGAHLVELRRTASGSFCQADSVTLDELSSLSLDNLLLGRVVSVRQALAGLAEFNLTDSGCKRIRNGIAPSMNDLEPLHGQTPGAGRVKLVFNEELQAVCDIFPARQGSEAVEMKLCRVFNLLSPLHESV